MLPSPARARQWLGAEAADDFIGMGDKTETPQLAQVGEAELRPVVEGEDGAQVALSRGRGVSMQEGAGHAQVDDEVEAAG
jgi:hypothetical protein